MILGLLGLWLDHMRLPLSRPTVLLVVVTIVSGLMPETNSE